jgi:RNA polymerase sigma-54 factor
MRPSLHTHLEMKQAKALILSPQMQQALVLLQLPIMELSQALLQELEQNPVLEYSEEEEKIENNDILFEVESRYKLKTEQSDLQSALENTISYPVSLFEALMEQARDCFDKRKDLALAELIIGSLNDAGFLESSLEELALLSGEPSSQLESILNQIQNFDPPGVGARDLKESLLLQLKRQGKEKSLVYNIIESSFEEIKSNKLKGIAKSSGHSVDEIHEIIETEMAKLTFHPATSFSQNRTEVIVPDVILALKEGEVVIEVNERSIPPFRINPHYLQLLTQESLPEETRDYILEKIASGKWFLRNLVERQKTLQRITEQIYQRQKEYFHSNQGNLISLTMKELGDTLGIHESTVARAVASKYLSSPRGLQPLRTFFTHAYVKEDGGSISAPAVKEILQKIIAAEDRFSPLSDDAISEIMKKRGIPCARRTIAKYRSELGLGTRAQRKK